MQKFRKNCLHLKFEEKDKILICQEKEKKESEKVCVDE
jgi:hypothetical protein